ncbi:MAG: hypothetical protein JAZ11_11175 [Candidatus Thiodiazotropha lotti]|nr:hypothetical protein [Candidatus Thiodiazotropha lotti]
MSNTSINTDAESIFGDVIYTYTRAQAIEDGVLVDAGSMAQEAGFKWPVALTSAVWEDCVAWTDDDSRKKPFQDQSGRLWDVLYMASHAIRTSKDSGDRMMFQLYRVPRDGHSTEAVLVTLKLIVGPGDAGEPVITILLPDED